MRLNRNMILWSSYSCKQKELVWFCESTVPLLMEARCPALSEPCSGMLCWQASVLQQPPPRATDCSMRNSNA